MARTATETVEAEQGADQLAASIGSILDPAWQAVRQNHPDLPAVTFELNTSSTSCLASTLPPTYWYRDDPIGLSRIAFTPAGLFPAVDGQPDRTFATLVHEGAHVLERIRHGFTGDHRRRFKAIAEEMHLSATLTPPDPPKLENMRRRHPYVPEWQIYGKMQDYCLRNAKYTTIGNGELDSFYAAPIAALADALMPWRDWLRHQPRSRLSGPRPAPDPHPPRPA